MSWHWKSLFVTGVLLATASHAWAQTANPPGDGEELPKAELRFDDYEAKLNAILKTRRDEEKQFVSEVVDGIEQGTIPEKLVETSFKWVGNKRPDTNYPFIYFERVLRLQAKKINVQIPEFDYSIYRQQPAGRRR
jgi:hypothetical protein